MALLEELNLFLLPTIGFLGWLVIWSIFHLLLGSGRCSL